MLDVARVVGMRTETVAVGGARTFAVGNCSKSAGLEGENFERVVFPLPVFELVLGSPIFECALLPIKFRRVVEFLVGEEVAALSGAGGGAVVALFDTDCWGGGDAVVQNETCC